MSQEGAGPGRRFGGYIAGGIFVLASLIAIWQFLSGDTPTYPPFGGRESVAFAPEPLSSDQEAALERFLGFLTVKESQHVRLNVVMVDSPAFADKEDPLDLRGRFVTFFLGETADVGEEEGRLYCGGEPCQENDVVLVSDDPVIVTVKLGDRLLVGGAAIGIRWTARLDESVVVDEGDPRLRGCFFNIGEKPPRREVDLLFPVFLLRPAPGVC